MSGEAANTDAILQSVLKHLREPSWKSLLLLGFCWLVVAALAIGEVVDNLVILLGVLVLGHLGAAVLSGRSRWWLHGAAAVAGLVLVALFAEELQATAYGYPASTLGWVPFRNGATLQWRAFYLSLAVAVATGMALKPPARHTQLTRAGTAAVVAFSYFAIPHRWVPDSNSQVGGMTIIVVVLVVVGVADTVVIWADRRGRGALVGAVAVPFVSLALLVVAAGVFWTFRARLTPSMPTLLPPDRLLPEPSNAMALSTVAVVVLGSLIVSAYVVPKILRGTRTARR